MTINETSTHSTPSPDVSTAKAGGKKEPDQHHDVVPVVGIPPIRWWLQYEVQKYIYQAVDAQAKDQGEILQRRAGEYAEIAHISLAKAQDKLVQAIAKWVISVQKGEELLFPSDVSLAKARDKVAQAIAQYTSHKLGGIDVKQQKTPPSQKVETLLVPNETFKIT